MGSKILRAIKSSIGVCDEVIDEVIDDMGSKIQSIEVIEDKTYTSQSHTEDISFIEFAILNSFLHDAYHGKHEEININTYGDTDSIGRINFGGAFDITQPFWFSGTLKGDKNNIILQTKIFIDTSGELVSQFHISLKKGITRLEFQALYKKLKILAFNKSEYKGNFISIKLIDGRFRGIEIIEIGEATNKLILTDVQEKFIRHFINRLSRGGNARYLLNGEPGTGKAQPLTSKILTPSGWTTMGDIKVGDKVITPMGKISKVTDIYPQGVKDIYEIETKDGKKSEACNEHLWRVYGLPKGKNRLNSWDVLTSLEIKEKIENTKYKLKLPLVSNNLNNEIKVDWEIPPYLMGLFLGDGSFNEDSIKISSGDDFILNKIRDMLPINLNLIHDDKYDYLITRKEGKGYKGGEYGNSYVKEIKRLGLSDKRSHTKFIPDLYKSGSSTQKKELLQGLMDSNGTVDKSSHLSYSTTSYQLAKDFQEIIWSIGGICQIKEKQTFYTYKNVKKKGKLSYNLNIRISDQKSIVSLPRKLNLLSENYQYKDVLKNEIISIKFIGRKKAQCIRIDDENHLYITNDYIVTHNTESIREIARELLPNVTFIIPEFSTSDDLTSIMEACEIFDNGVIVMDDIDLYLGSRDNGSYTRLLGQFLSFFDGVKKRKISLLASTNDKGLVDKAAERPGRFNFTLDFTFLNEDQIISVCNIHLDKKWRVKEVYDALKSNVNGEKVKITGAFIANLADNIREMSEDEKDWSVNDTVSLITESYKGFYSSQTERDKKMMGFN